MKMIHEYSGEDQSVERAAGRRRRDQPSHHQHQQEVGTQGIICPSQ